MKINSVTSMYNSTLDLDAYRINTQFTQINASRVTEVRMTVIRLGGQSPDVPEPTPDIVVGEFSQVVNVPNSVRIVIQNAAGPEEVPAIIDTIYKAYDQIIAEYTTDNA